MNFKSTPAAALADWADYHLLLGVDHMVFIDNNCGDGGRLGQARLVGHPPWAVALSPYVNAGVATLVTRYRCFDFNNSFGAPALRYRVMSEEATASPLRERMRDDTLVLTIDDDEYMVMPDPRETLATVAQSMKLNQLCAANVIWRNFGDAGYTCQPQMPAVGAFWGRAPLWQEAEEHRPYIKHALEEAQAKSLNSGFRKGKALFIWGHMRDCNVASPQNGWKVTVLSFVGKATGRKDERQPEKIRAHGSACW